MLTKLKDYEKQLSEMDKKLSDSEFMKDMKAYTQLTMERSHLAPIVETMHRLVKIDEEINDAIDELIRFGAISKKGEIIEYKKVFKPTKTHK